MTYGEIRLQLRQQFQGTSLDIIDQIIMDRHQEILDALSWSRLDSELAINTTAEYSEGTVTAAAGSTAVQGAGTTWDATMNGSLIRIAAADEFYAFTFSDDVTGSLSPAFVGTGGAGLAYRINKNLYALDVTVRRITGARLATGPLVFQTREEFNQQSPGRSEYGTPKYWSWQMDSTSDPPQLQLELYPTPTEAMAVYLSVTKDAGGLEKGVPGSSTLPWERPACLLAGCRADLYELTKNPTQQDRAERRFESLKADMVRVEADRIGPIRLKMHPNYTAHQVRRYTR